MKHDMAFESWMDSNGYLESEVARRAWNAGALHALEQIKELAADLKALQADAMKWREREQRTAKLLAAGFLRNPLRNAPKRDE